jgi:predicted chitinase
VKDAQEFWSVDEIARVTECPRDSVERNWPLIHFALVELGIASRRQQAAAIATTAIETASTFEPVRESFWVSEETRRRIHARYYPYYGRGFVQLTWSGNYAAAGERLGMDLVNNPDLALDPSIAAWNLAYYFRDRGVADAAARGDWVEVRARVQGADAGLPRLITIVRALGTHDAPTTSEAEGVVTAPEERETPDDWPWLTWYEAAVNLKGICDELGHKWQDAESRAAATGDLAAEVDALRQRLTKIKELAQ